MVEDIMQLEFPYTRQGALQAYNDAQIKHFRIMYNNYFMEQQNPHYLSNFEEFLVDNVRVHAPLFAKENSEKFYSKAVEKQTGTSVDAWMDNRLFGEHKIYQTLEHLLNEGEVQKDDSI